MLDLVDRFTHNGFAVLDLPCQVPDEILNDLRHLNTQQFSDEDNFRSSVLALQQRLNHSLFHHRVVKALFAPLLALGQTDSLLVSGVAFLRVVRPISLSSHYEYLDFHRESFYGTGSFVHEQINIHVPILGYSDASAMHYVPMSHLLPDDAFTLSQVPEEISGVTRGSAKHLQGMLYRPRPIVSGCDLNSAVPFPVEVGQVLVFKSDLIHGGGVNRGTINRVSSDFAVIPSSSIDASKNSQLASYDPLGAKYVKLS